MIRSRESRQPSVASGRQVLEESVLRESESILRSLYDSAGMMMGVVELLDNDILFLSSNIATGRFFGFSLEALEQRRTSELGMSAEQIQCWLHHYRESERTGRPARFEYPHIDASGTRWLSATVYPIAARVAPRPRFCFVVEEITDRKQVEDELAQSRRLFEQIAEATPNVLFLFDIQAEQNVYTNREVSALLGYAPEQLTALGPAVLSHLMHPEDRPRIKAAHQRFYTLADGEVLEHEYRMRHVDGSYRWFVSRDTIFSRAPDGTPHQILGVAQDVTERKEAETALQASEERLRRQNAVLIELAREKVHHLDLAAAFRSITETAARTLQVARASIWLYNDAQSLLRCVDLYEQELDRHSRGLELFASDYPAYFRALREERIITADDARADSRTREFLASYLRPLGITSMLDAPIRLGNQMVGVVCHEQVGADRRWTLDEESFARSMADRVSLLMEASERQRAEATVRWQAYHDPLTGLPNRLRFQQRLTEAIREAQQHQGSAAVLFVDLDRFKQINDTLGHEVGDTFLQIVARRLTGCTRDDTVVARLGGDEFTLLLPRVAGPEETTAIAERVMAALRQPVSLCGLELSVNASIGISLFPTDGTDAQTLLKHADIAMYRTKKEGYGGYQLYTPAMHTAALERLVLETRLRKALEIGELILHYQPQIEVTTGKVVGVEALLRWQHPERGLVLPADIIPLAEETGLIHPIGEWVLVQACRTGAEWQSTRLPLRVAVNVSAYQFRRPGLVRVVQRVLEETGLLPQRLELELTETALIENNPTVLETLEGLRQLGVRLSVDDFGTGYSSLSYLRRLPFDVLKIDHSFVHQVAEDGRDYAVVRAVIQMAQALDLEVVAEGVETAAHRDCLAELGCPVMQGVFFHPALSADALERLFATDGASASGEAHGPAGTVQ